MKKLLALSLIIMVTLTGCLSMPAVNTEPEGETFLYCSLREGKCDRVTVYKQKGMEKVCSLEQGTCNHYGSSTRIRDRRP